MGWLINLVEVSTQSDFVAVSASPISEFYSQDCALIYSGGANLVRFTANNIFFVVTLFPNPEVKEMSIRSNRSSSSSTTPHNNAPTITETLRPIKITVVGDGTVGK